MELIKIGKSQACQIIFDDKTVSSLHAEITIFDDGTLAIEDKNSLNGTFVNGKRIEPLKSVPVHRGDKITFGNSQLAWSRVPMHEDLSKYKRVCNIGSNYQNDIVLSNQTVSSFHAQVRVDKSGKVFIRDNGSTNGTKVNGKLIEKKKNFRIRKKDVVICSTEDISEQLQQFFPRPIGKNAAIAALSAVALAVLAFVIIKFTCPPPPPEKVRTGVVYIRTIYHPIVTFKDNPLPKDVWSGVVEIDDTVIVSQATAFFLDKEGRMATNRHAAAPWEELSEIDKEKIRTIIERNLPSKNIETFDDLENFYDKSMFGKVVFQHAVSRYGKSLEALNHMVRLVAQLRKSSYEITGKIDHFAVGYPGKYYTHADEFQRCNVLKVSENKDIDLAILQLNDKKTPESVKYIFDPYKAYTDKIEPLKDELTTIGYPAGITWSLDENIKSLEPSIRETKCSKEPSKYYFEFQANSVAGSSGSPVYNKKGQLVGILFGGYAIAGGATKAIHAKFLKRMYEEEMHP